MVNMVTLISFFTFNMLLLFICSNIIISTEDITVKNNKELLVNDCACFLKMTQPIIFTTEDIAPRKILKTMSENGIQVAMQRNFSVKKFLEFSQHNYRIVHAIVVGNMNEIAEALATALEHNLLLNSGTMVLICMDCGSQLPKVPLPKDVMSRVFYVPFNEYFSDIFEVYYSYHKKDFVKRPFATWNKTKGLTTLQHPAKMGNDLENATLKIAAYKEMATTMETLFVCEKNSKNCKGYFYDVLDTLSAQMNFRYDIQEYRNWSEFLKGFKQDINSNLAIGCISWTVNRTDQFSFSSPVIYEEEAVALVKSARKGTMAKLTWLWRAFDVHVWLATFLSFALLWIIQVCIYKWVPHTESETVYVTIYAFLQQGVVNFPIQTSSKMLFLINYLCFWLLCVHFSGLLTSSLTLDISNNKIKTVEELAFLTKYKIGVVKNAVIDETIQASKNQVFKELSRRAEMKIGTEEATDLFCKKKCAFLTVKALVYYLIANRTDCEPYFLKKLLFISPCYFVAKKHDILGKRISKTINKMRQHGVLQHLLFKHNLEHGHKILLKMVTETVRISSDHILFPFLLLAVGNVMALIIAFIERLYHNHTFRTERISET